MALLMPAEIVDELNGVEEGDDDDKMVVFVVFVKLRTSLDVFLVDVVKLLTGCGGEIGKFGGEPYITIDMRCTLLLSMLA